MSAPSWIDDAIGALPPLVTVEELVTLLRVRGLTPAELLAEAARCAQSDFAVIGDASQGCSGTIDCMVYRRAEMRLDLALALADYRERFGVRADEDQAVSS